MYIDEEFPKESDKIKEFKKINLKNVEKGLDEGYIRRCKLVGKSTFIMRELIKYETHFHHKSFTKRYVEWEFYDIASG